MMSRPVWFKEDIMKKILIPTFLFAFIYGCGPAAEMPTFPSADSYLPLDGSNIWGLYEANLEPLNGQVAGPVHGKVSIDRRFDKIVAKVNFKDGPAGMSYHQRIHTNPRCPEPADDKDGDGLINREEALSVVGPALIPLDNDLNSQTAGSGYMPVSNYAGDYFYERSARFSFLFEDLRKEDENPGDDLEKLGFGRGFDFTGKAVLILSSRDDTPIACGILNWINEFPESPTTEVNTPPASAPAPAPAPSTDEASSSTRRWRTWESWRNAWSEWRNEGA
jgi:hypothetical protein